MSDNPSRFSPELVTLVKRTRFNPIRTLTPELLGRQMDSFGVGYLREFALTAEAIKKRDDKISVALPKREKAVSRRGYAVHLNDGLADAEQKRAAEHQEALKFFFDNLTVCHALEKNQRGGFRLLVRQMMEAVGYKYAVHEIVWQPILKDNKARLTASLTYAPLQFFENLTGALRFLPNFFGGIEGEALEPDNWLVTVGEGIMEPLAVAYMFKQLSLKDWVCFNEKFGTPGMLFKTSAAKDSPEWDAIVDAAEGFGQDWSAVVSEGTTAELIEAKGGAGTLPFPPMVERMDRAIATICRGADLSTMSAGQGQGQGASVQEDESDILEEDDAKMIDDTLVQLSRVVIRELFAGEQPLAYVSIVAAEKKDASQTRENTKLLVGMGGRVSRQWAHDEFGIPEAAEGEDLLTQPAPSATSLGGPAAAAFANAADDARSRGREAIFRAAALEQLTEAQRSALQPLVDRIAEIEGIEDETAQDAALVKLQGDLPRLYRQVLQDPATMGAFEAILGSAVVSGATEAAQEKGTATKPASAKP